MLGWWIDENDVNYLFATLALKDEDFAKEITDMGHVTAHERRRFIAALEAHIDQCPHCSLKRGYDLELDARNWRRRRNDLLRRGEGRAVRIRD